jgi:cytidylate kinase
VARKLAGLLGYNYVDTGAMYRAVTLIALTSNVSIHDTEALTRLAEELEIRFERGANDETLVIANGRDVTRDIRTPEVSRFVSLVAQVPGVRGHLTDKQRTMAGLGQVVMDGRDIGTVVLPEAGMKIFLTATVEERARRRFFETAGEGYSISLQDHIDEIGTRDILDASREIAPLVQAPDAVVIDTTGKDPDQVVELILSLLRGG